MLLKILIMLLQTHQSSHIVPAWLPVIKAPSNLGRKFTEGDVTKYSFHLHVYSHTLTWNRGTAKVIFLSSVFCNVMESLPALYNNARIDVLLNWTQRAEWNCRSVHVDFYHIYKGRCPTKWGSKSGEQPRPVTCSGRDDKKQRAASCTNPLSTIWKPKCAMKQRATHKVNKQKQIFARSSAFLSTPPATDFLI